MIGHLIVLTTEEAEVAGVERRDQCLVPYRLQSHKRMVFCYCGGGDGGVQLD